MSDETFSFRWGIPLLDEGHTSIPNFFFDAYMQTGVTRIEFLLILHLARYQYETPGSECRPSVPTVAKQMGYSKRTIQRLLGSLEEKGMLVRYPRTGDCNIYDFSGFSRAVLTLAVDNYSNVCSRGDTCVTPPHDTCVTPPMTHVSPKEEKEEEHHKKDGDGVVHNLLAAHGINEPVLSQLAQGLKPELAQAVVLYSMTQELSNPAGWIVTQIREGIRPPDDFMALGKAPQDALEWMFEHRAQMAYTDYWPEDMPLSDELADVWWRHFGGQGGQRGYA